EALAGRDERRLDRLAVAGQELRPRLVLPLRRGRRAAGDLDRRGDVRERPQHPSDVAEGRPLAPALGERPCRLALEVDHDPAVARPQHLAEVVVAVVTDDAADAADLRAGAEVLADVLPAAGDRLEL